MLYNEVYNSAFTPDIKQAIIRRDSDFFANEILRLCQKVVDSRETKDLEVTQYDIDLTRLHLCLAFLDSLQRYGETVKFLNDMVNF